MMNNVHPIVKECSICSRPFWSLSGNDEVCFSCSFFIEREKKIEEEKRKHAECKNVLSAVIDRTFKENKTIPSKVDGLKLETQSPPWLPVPESKLKELARRRDLIERQRMGRSGYVYLMRSANGLYKIGRSKDVERRRNDLNRQFPIQIGVVHSVFCKDFAKAERDLHHKYKQKRVQHEWFDLSPQDVAWFMSLKDGDLA